MTVDLSLIFSIKASAPISLSLVGVSAIDMFASFVK